MIDQFASQRRRSDLSPDELGSDVEVLMPISIALQYVILRFTFSFRSGLHAIVTGTAWRRTMFFISTT